MYHLSKNRRPASVLYHAVWFFCVMVCRNTIFNDPEWCSLTSYRININYRDKHDHLITHHLTRATLAITVALGLSGMLNIMGVLRNHSDIGNYRLSRYLYDMVLKSRNHRRVHPH